MMYAVKTTEELSHHGILGMKWGVRRYQNKDGSLTAAGKRRRKEVDTENWSDDAKKVHALKKKSVNEMSDAELRAYTNRVQLEQQYKRLNPSAVKKGLVYATTAAAALGTITTLIANSQKIIKIGKKAADAAKLAVETAKIADKAGVTTVAKDAIKWVL